MKNYDIIIIGGGILGTFHAYHALKKGLSVALFEKNQQPKGATVRNFGQIVPSGMDEKWRQYGRRSVEIYKEIQAEFDISVRQNGSIYIASDEEEMTLLEEMAAINKAEDYTSILFSKKSCLYNYEGLKEDYCKSGLFFPDEITVEPRFAVSRILEYCVEKWGLHYFSNTLVVDLQLFGEGTVAVDASKNRYYADKVIVCSGAEFKTLFPALFAQSDIEISKLQMMQTFPQPTQRIKGSILTGLSIRRYEAFRACPSYPKIKANEPQDTMAKTLGVHILFKQATDGSVIIGDTHEYADVAEADNIGFDNQPFMNDFMLSEAKKIFDLQRWDIQRNWYGIYPQCKNQDIFLHDIENKIHIVTAIGGKGMTASAGFSEKNLERIMER
jgi:FAD dependent oxidoreductase TIGR03364